MRNCPKCGDKFERKDADRCDTCGWTKRKQEAAQSRERGAVGVGVDRCAWNSNDQRCAYPGAIWKQPYGAQQGMGYCRFHAQEDCTAAYGAEVVRESHENGGVLPKPEKTHACQERTCHITVRALPGKHFCAKHQAQFEREPASVRRIGLPGNVRAMLRAWET